MIYQWYFGRLPKEFFSCKPIKLAKVVGCNLFHLQHAKEFQKGCIRFDLENEQQPLTLQTILQDYYGCNPSTLGIHERMEK